MEENLNPEQQVSSSEGVSNAPANKLSLSKNKLIFLGIAGAILVLCLLTGGVVYIKSQSVSSPSPSPTPSAEASASPNETPSPSPSITPKASVSPTPRASATVTPSSVSTPTPTPTSSKGTVSVQFYKWDTSAPVYLTGNPITGTTATIHFGGTNVTGSPNGSLSMDPGNYAVTADAPSGWGSYHAEECTTAGCGSATSVNSCGYNVTVSAGSNIVIKCWYSQ